METVNLDVQTRDKSIKAKQLLAKSILPLEYYGKGVENRSLQVDYQTFRRVLREAGGNTIIELTIDGKDKVEVLVHEVKYDPITDEMVHIDLINVKKGQEITAKIPLEFVGQAPAVKDLGGTFNVQMSEVEVKCLPKDLIHNIEVDISTLEDFSVYIRVKDLIVPKSLNLLHEDEDVVASVSPPRAEEEETAEETEESGLAKDASAEAGSDNQDSKKDEPAE